jgi:hypothetical protein
MLLHYDGGDHYGNANSEVDDVAPNMYALNNMRLRLAGPPTPFSSLTTPTPRTGLYCFGSSVLTSYRKSLGADYDKVGHGFGFYMPALPDRRVQYTIAAMLDVNSAPLVVLRMGVTGKVFITTSAGVVLGSCDREISPGAWNHIEWVVDRATAGNVEIRINEKVFFDAAINTNPTGLGIHQIYAGPINPGLSDFSGEWYYDDLVMWEGDSLVGVSDFVGMSGVYTLRPIADAAPQDWDVTSGAVAWALLNGATPDGDTNFIFSDTIGDQTRVEVENLPANIISVQGVKPYALVRKTDTGPADISLAVESGGVVQEVPDFTVLTAYNYADAGLEAIVELDPNTAAAWDPLAMPNVQIERKL